MVTDLEERKIIDVHLNDYYRGVITRETLLERVLFEPMLSFETKNSWHIALVGKPYTPISTVSETDEDLI